MNKEIFEKAFIDSLNINFDRYKKYFDFDFYVYPELRPLIFEIIKCLILGFNSAAITLTNHILERGLKLSLIYNETGIGPIPTEKWDSVFSEPNKKFSSFKLGNSIEKCRKEGLLTESEKDVLFDTIRDLMRNGFSHGDPTLILAGLPNETTVFLGNLSLPTELKKISLNQKAIPVLQSIHIEYFVKENAMPYFDFVFELMKNIDLRLKEKFK